MPPLLRLALTPTPLIHALRLSEWLGVDVWVKRDDLTGLAMSGNKVRKLELLLADAQAQEADTVVTCGGLQSNHCRATTVAARRVGLDPVVLLRGELPEVPDGNLLLNQLLGATVHTCTPDEYRDSRDARMEEIAEALRKKGKRPYVIPEGGSNGLGALAYARAAGEVAPKEYDAVVVAVGSGGTVCGLAIGPDIGPIKGVSVSDPAPVFVERVRQIAAQAAEVGGAKLPPHGEGWEIVDGYQGPAYAEATPEVWDTIAQVARLEGLLLDPVYTGKAMHALVSEVRAGRWGGRILFWHTGGAFGLFGRGHEIPR